MIYHLVMLIIGLLSIGIAIGIVIFVAAIVYKFLKFMIHILFNK